MERQGEAAAPRRQSLEMQARRVWVRSPLLRSLVKHAAALLAGAALAWSCKFWPEKAQRVCVACSVLLRGSKSE